MFDKLTGSRLAATGSRLRLSPGSDRSTSRTDHCWVVAPIAAGSLTIIVTCTSHTAALSLTLLIVPLKVSAPRVTGSRLALPSPSP